MQFSDLQLGDVVEFSKTGGVFAGKGTATIIGLDAKDQRSPIMLGWNEGEADIKLGHDNFAIPGATFLPDARTKFHHSLWMPLDVIVRKVGAPTTGIKVEHPCKQCRKMNDRGVGSCWWCGVSNPTS